MVAAYTVLCVALATRVASLAPLPAARALGPRARVAALRAGPEEAGSGEEAGGSAVVAEAAPEAAAEAAGEGAGEAEAPGDRVANAPKDYEDFNPDQPDIIQKFVKKRDDWWSADSPFPGAPVASGDGKAGPIDGLVQLPLPAYFWLLSATVGSIAFVGCIFQLFYNVPRAPVLGVPLTSVILVTSGPAFVFFFLVAIARGQKEADDDDAKYGM